MKKRWQYILFIFLAACKNGNDGDVDSTDSVSVISNDTISSIHAKPVPTEDIEVDSTTIATMPWIDSLMDVYMKKTKDESILSSIKAKMPVSWLYDKMFGTDSTFYIVLHLGHDMEDHFATNGWLYIDTLTRSIYAYDLPNDSIYKWKAN